MRAELPWNVAGIPPEAREAARAAARREGLSVGEWLTRHIMRSFSGIEGDTPGSDLQNTPSTGWDLPPQGDGPHDDDQATARTEQNAGQPEETWHRIEEQLRGIGRRLDSNERSHGESNRFLSRTAQEVNANAREQAQAFDQLGQSVHGLRERLERLERSAPGDNIREAIKALHLGLSKLAEQLTTTAGNSAGQIGQVTINLERLAVHVSKIWEDSDATTRLLNQRIEVAETELAQRLQASEQGLAARLSAAEKATKFNSNALDHALERIEAAAGERAAELAESQRRAIQHEQNIRELKESLSELESRLPGVRLEARFNAIERSIGGLKEAIVQHDPVIVFGSAVQGLAQRVEKLEGDHATLTTWDQPVQQPVEETAPAPETGASAAVEPLADLLQAEPAAEPEASVAVAQAEEPHILEQEAPVAEDSASETPAFKPFASEFDAIFPQRSGAEDSDLYFAPRDTEFHALPQAQEEDSDIAFHDVRVEPTPDDLLAQARLSAQAALDRAENERMMRDGPFHGQSLAGLERAPRPRYLIPVAAILLLALVATAALVMSERAKRLGEQLAANPTADKLPALPSLPSGTQPPAPSAQALADRQAAATGNDQTAEIPGTPRPALPAPDKETAPRKVATAAGDPVVQQASAGNPVALTILGLKALDGTGGTPVNLQDAVKLLGQAADKGHAFAQYRLGTLYERGQGVAADPVKAMHWYEMSAAQGNRKAMHNLAVAYASGPAARRNMTEAARWFGKAAALGLGDSQFNLAVLYERGEGVQQSLADAYKWYAIAALSGDAEAKSRMGVIENQVSDADKATANRAAASFHAAPLNRSANVPPEPADLGG